MTTSLQSRPRANGALETELGASNAYIEDGLSTSKATMSYTPIPPSLIDLAVLLSGKSQWYRSSTNLMIVGIPHLLIFALLFIFGSGYTTTPLFMGLVVTSGGLLFSFTILSWCLAGPNEGRPPLSEEMKAVKSWIQEGAEGFFHVQYGTIVILALVAGSLLGILFYFRDASAYPDGLSDLVGLPIAILTVSSFITGAFCSALAGYVGLWVSVRVNAEVANAAREDYNLALTLCFRGGAVCAVTNICLAVGGVSLSMLVVRSFFPSLAPQQVAILLTGFSFGASMVAMFAQLGGGIYTKAADIGADLVGKVENSIPEDDPRNPAVIADLVGDNVGDCAGQCADLFESISAEIISAMIIGGSLASERHLPLDESWRIVLFPLLVHSLDIVVSSIGSMQVRSAPGPASLENADPLATMIKAYGITCSLASLGLLVVCRYCLYIASAPYAWMYYFAAAMMGLFMAGGFVLVTQYYTDYQYSKVRSIAQASSTGPATNIITGLAVGMESTGFPVLMISVAVLTAYRLGKATGLTPDSRLDGLFGCAAATMGMLSTAGFILTMSSFGPIADNAGGIVELTSQPASVRAVTDRLDAVGNVTKANTKGFSIGSAALACFLLFSAFIDEVELYSKIHIPYIDLASPEVFIGGLLGGMLVFVFAGKALEAVSAAAQETVKECRRQFRENPGILDGTVKADYQTCVAISNRAALKQMILPGMLATLSPVAVGYTFRVIGDFRGDQLLGVHALVAFQVFATAVGILMALFLNNAGGAWDNAKKYIESGPLGGKNSAAHKAAVVGDTVGDPCKDTAGPSVHVLIKLVCTVSIVLTPLFIGTAPK